MSTTLNLSQFIDVKLSFSTADIEKTVFYGKEQTPINTIEPIGNTMILLVNGESFVLEEGFPQQSIPLTENSGLFKIIGLDQQG